MYELRTESPGYRKLRAELLEAEIALKEQRERVAELRRQLPTDTPVDDYAFQRIDLRAGGGVSPVSLSGLIGDGQRPLVLMHFMYGGAQTSFCPMCTMWADGYDGAVPHMEQRVAFGVVVAGDVEAFAAHGRERGWRNLRLLSSEGTSFKTDFGMENGEGGQMPGASVFVRGADGAPRHFYTGGAFMDGGHFRGMDLLSPVWHFLDLTRQGRSDWMPALSYE